MHLIINSRLHTNCMHTYDDALNAYIPGKVDEEEMSVVYPRLACVINIKDKIFLE